jgi:DNA/RNA endonuclease G (NUC1)
VVSKFGTAFVFTGPLFVPQCSSDSESILNCVTTFKVLGSKNASSGGVAVPTHFFKVIAVPSEDNEFAVAAIVVPNKQINQKAKISSFFVSLAELEQLSGLDLSVISSSSKSLCESFPEACILPNFQGPQDKGKPKKATS